MPRRSFQPRSRLAFSEIVKTLKEKSKTPSPKIKALTQRMRWIAMNATHDIYREMGKKLSWFRWKINPEDLELAMNCNENFQQGWSPETSIPERKDKETLNSFAQELRNMGIQNQERKALNHWACCGKIIRKKEETHTEETSKQRSGKNKREIIISQAFLKTIPGYKLEKRKRPKDTSQTETNKKIKTETEANTDSKEEISSTPKTKPNPKMKNAPRSKTTPAKTKLGEMHNNTLQSHKKKTQNKTTPRERRTQINRNLT